jgi:hypothetical protein
MENDGCVNKHSVGIGSWVGQRNWTSWKARVVCVSKCRAEQTDWSETGSSRKQTKSAEWKQAPIEMNRIINQLLMSSECNYPAERREIGKDFECVFGGRERESEGEGKQVILDEQWEKTSDNDEIVQTKRKVSKANKKRHL